MKKIIRLTEHDLFKIVKQVINEHPTFSPTFNKAFDKTIEELKLKVEGLYKITPDIPSEGATSLYVLVNNGKIYSYDRFAKEGNKVGKQIGGWLSSSAAYKAQKENSPIYKNGNDYVFLKNNGMPNDNYFSNRAAGDTTGYAFIFNERGEPTLIGLTNQPPYVKAKPATRLETETPTPSPPPTSPPVVPPVPQLLSLDLKNLFHYDCPTPQNPGNELFGCGRISKSDGRPSGGSDTQPFRNPKEAEDLINKFANGLLSVSNFPTIRDKTFYVIGFASTEGTPQHNFMLSLSRAEYVADMLTDITGGKIKFVGVGKGATTVFGDDLPSNRRVIVTTNPESTSPVQIKIVKGGSGNIESVSVIPGK